MDPANERLEEAARLVRHLIDEQFLEKTDPKPEYYVYVVWFNSTLQNWKALVSTTLPDGMYYEVTRDGDKQETYVDAYKKVLNMVFSTSDVPVSVPPTTLYAF